MPIVEAKFDAESIPHIHFARGNQFHAQLLGSKNRRASLHVAGAQSVGRACPYATAVARAPGTLKVVGSIPGGGIYVFRVFR